ncbi:MAG: DUF5925 domain-containing protein [Acidimicrobiales bacterium]
MGTGNAVGDVLDTIHDGGDHDGVLDIEVFADGAPGSVVQSIQYSADGAGGLRPAMEQMALLAFLSGEQCHGRETTVVGLRDLWPLSALAAHVAALLPEGHRELRSIQTDHGSGVLARGEGWTAAVGAWWASEVEVAVSARSAALADRVLATILSRLPPREVSEPDAVTVTVWRAGRHGPAPDCHQIPAQSWPEVARNYPSPVRMQLDQLMNLTEPPAKGRLVLFHGEAGTGKTSAVRTLARSWAPWARLHCVMDPECFFADPDYMLRVLLRDDEEAEWKLVVLEDAGELLAADARQQAGAALARLLNLTDGILGQGLPVLILVTTNEPLGCLHPAVTRAGRCLANICLPRFSAREASAWLGEAGLRAPKDGATLAELYGLRDATLPIELPSHFHSGTYL